MISCPSVEKRVIRTHYNLATPFYRLLWGRHIHHGLWEGSESPAEAQLKLTQTLSREAGLQGGERVLDVGCGMGGSSIYLAKTLGCHVTGITLSSVQRRWASVAARLNGVGGKTPLSGHRRRERRLRARVVRCGVERRVHRTSVR